MRVGAGIRNMAGRVNRTPGVAAEKTGRVEDKANHGANATATGTDTTLTVKSSHPGRPSPPGISHPGAMVVPGPFSSILSLIFPHFSL